MGHNWTRFLIATLLYPQQPVTFVNIGQLVPDAAAFQSNRYIRRISSPRTIKSHTYSIRPIRATRFLPNTI